MCDILQQENAGVTRFALVTLSHEATPQIQQCTELKQAKSITENISPAFIELLGSAWALNVDFFVDHAVGCRGDLSRVPFNLSSVRERAPFLCVAGVLSYDSDAIEAIYDDDDVAESIPEYLDQVRKHFFRRDFRFRTDGKGAQLDSRTSYYVKSLRRVDWSHSQPAVCLIDPPVILSKASDIQGVIRFPLADSLYSVPLDIKCEDGIYDAMTKFLRREGPGYYERCIHRSSICPCLVIVSLHSTAMAGNVEQTPNYNQTNQLRPD